MCVCVLGVGGGRERELLINFIFLAETYMDVVVIFGFIILILLCSNLPKNFMINFPIFDIQCDFEKMKEKNGDVVCVCICVYMCVYTYTYSIHIHIHTYTYICIYIRYTYTHVYIIYTIYI